MDDEMAAMMGFGGFGKKAPPKKSTVTEANLERTKRDRPAVRCRRPFSPPHRAGTPADVSQLLNSTDLYLTGEYSAELVYPARGIVGSECRPALGQLELNSTARSRRRLYLLELCKATAASVLSSWFFNARGGGRAELSPAEAVRG